MPTLKQCPTCKRFTLNTKTELCENVDSGLVKDGNKKCIQKDDREITKTKRTRSQKPIFVHSVEEEYEYIKSYRCSCGGNYEFDSIDLIPGPRDRMFTLCQSCKKKKVFTFDISYFMQLNESESTEAEVDRFSACTSHLNKHQGLNKPNKFDIFYSSHSSSEIIGNLTPKDSSQDDPLLITSQFSTNKRSLRNQKKEALKATKQLSRSKVSNNNISNPISSLARRSRSKIYKKISNLFKP